MDQQSSILQIGVPLDASSPLFFACLLAAVAIVYVACRKKFAERSVTGSEDYIYQFLPRQLATREEYSKGFMTYFGSIALMVVLLSLIGPKNVASLGITFQKEVSYVVLPLAIAFVLVGALQNVPGLSLLEQMLRQYAHERAYIPAAARATAERLAAADFDFSVYQAALQSPEMRGVEVSDFTRSRRSLEHDWARLSALVYELKSRREAGVTGPLDAGLLRDYEKDLDLIEERQRAMEDEVAAYRTERAKNPGYTNDKLRESIRNNLYKLYVLMGCAVRLKKQPYDDINLALRPFGFKLHRSNTQPPEDLKLTEIGGAAACALLLLFGAVLLAHLKLWAVTPVFAQNFWQPFLDFVPATLPFAAAIFVADLMRRYQIGKGTWFGPAGRRKRRMRPQYIHVALVCGALGYLALVLWGFAQKAPTLDGLKIDLPYALLAMVTGAFYVYHLDNVEMNDRPTLVWEAGPQAVLTGIVGLIAALASWEIVLPTAHLVINGKELSTATDVLDKVVLTAVVSAGIGLWLACYIPRAAAEARYDPLAEARDDRVRTLQAAAMEHFGDTAASTAWLEKPNVVLEGKAPKVAAEQLDGFERAIALLHGPKMLDAA